ncbi:uncharacterized protein BYT42DRAFT_565139 [Radiomyces spectabilis]|uniref:uncharacterized protein n=1 Tax=Radiomyces spectabilis TaxID=64574 RepID=UPI00221EDB27|nr:uncharacterized protein BYT42DRAFT_565139 [Radiomyces spectabilis]KAI8381071.1 hypothetical protein BYT42DRAFT_565139 [Radiomyces spectabilis]
MLSRQVFLLLLLLAPFVALADPSRHPPQGAAAHMVPVQQLSKGLTSESPHDFCHVRPMLGWQWQWTTQPDLVSYLRQLLTRIGEWFHWIISRIYSSFDLLKDLYTSPSFEWHQLMVSLGYRPPFTTPAFVIDEPKFLSLRSRWRQGQLDTVFSSYEQNWIKINMKEWVTYSEWETKSAFTEWYAQCQNSEVISRHDLMYQYNRLEKKLYRRFYELNLLGNDSLRTIYNNLREETMAISKQRFVQHLDRLDGLPDTTDRLTFCQQWKTAQLHTNNAWTSAMHELEQQNVYFIQRVIEWFLLLLRLIMEMIRNLFSPSR